jgi:hypothetical protein
MTMSKNKDILAALEDAGIYDVFFHGSKLQVINDYDLEHVTEIVGATGVTIEMVDGADDSYYGA